MEPLWISLKTAGVATAITFFVAILAARGRLALPRALGPFVDGVLMLPLALPPTVLGFVLLLILGRSSPVGHLLESVGVTLVFNWPATVIAAAVVSFPILYATALGAFRGIDRDLIDAARILGMREWDILWYVMLPLGWTSLASGVVLSFMRALGEFGATLMLAGNRPGITQTAPMAIFFGVQGGDHVQPLALSFALLGVAISALVLLQNLSRRFEIE